jgi:hypothetical protein
MMDHEVIDRLARIETKLDGFVTNTTDHEKRIRSVERKQWFVSGGATVFGALIGVFAKAKGVV